jgi:RES domain-containing protein
VRAWRIFDHNAPFARQPDFNPLSGEGGLHGYARWHHKGQPVLYAASSPSLALLEVLVHVDPLRFNEQTLHELELDGDVEEVSKGRLLQLLRDAPEGDMEACTRDYGKNWLQEQRSVGLVAPSIVMPFESNIIINPLHPQAREIRIITREVLTLDARLLRNLEPDE